ncbi:response regulator transcription factor [Azospirillum halopraeferens]|uniref:response regulator transcription factor n=1 Tax=Azospirillum halopraeferens TaxID=34010 RepID=UPI00041E4DAF|nr:response regulator [Azospirillum halopraeferens]
MEEAPLVLVVDDDEGMRTSVAFLLASVGIACETCASAEDLLRSPRLRPPLRPGCILLDVRMPGMSGIELLRHLKQRGCKRPVIMITGHGDVPLAVSALKAGAEDFIEKPFKDQELLDAINAAIRRSRSILEHSAEREAVEARLARLSRREREVLALVLDGKQNKEIAAALAISIKTVEGHRQMAMEKMGARSLAELVRMMVTPAAAPH